MKTTFDPDAQVKVFFEFDTGMLTLEQNSEKLYIDRIGLKHAHFYIDEKLKKQMMVTGKRLVHAWAVGFIEPIHKDTSWKAIRYQPQFHDGWHFEGKEDQLITYAERVYIDDRRAYISPTATVRTSTWKKI
jgi:hypothetical protein